MRIRSAGMGESSPIGSTSLRPAPACRRRWCDQPLRAEGRNRPPLPFTAHTRGPARLGHELASVKKRLERENLTVLGYRFAGDRFCTAQRFAAYAEALRYRFVARVLPTEAANLDPPPFFLRVVGCAHSVVTAHLIDAAGEPTIAARDEILSFFARRLTVRRLRCKRGRSGWSLSGHVNQATGVHAVSAISVADAGIVGADQGVAAGQDQCPANSRIQRREVSINQCSGSG